MGPIADDRSEALFEKTVYGAFSGTDLEQWLRSQRVQTVLVVGFYTHGCLSTSCREAIDRGFEVLVDAEATGAREIDHLVLGRQSADEVRRAALLHLIGLGARLV